MSNTIFQGACQVNNDKLIQACFDYKELYNRLLAIYNEDMERLKNNIYVTTSFFGRSKKRSSYDDFIQLGMDSWRSMDEIYTTYWKDGKGINWTPLEKAVFLDSYEEVYYQLKKLSSMNSDTVLITPDQANFINKKWKWGEK